jgi:hypothetical protein
MEGLGGLKDHHAATVQRPAAGLISQPEKGGLKRAINHISDPERRLEKLGRDRHPRMPDHANGRGIDETVSGGEQSW